MFILSATLTTISKSKEISSQNIFQVSIIFLNSTTNAARCEAVHF
ncbi:MAG: hypothetical protein U9Q66_00700 [Patescibacteria group bacterium]|nr:hypothetical protein [Patescibacteria group bacterium]